eukprot:scaffold2659_cov107-Cylindrotheca_fusiformis.AAC.14
MPRHGTPYFRLCIGLSILALTLLNALVAVEHFKVASSNDTACTITVPSPAAFVFSSNSTNTIQRIRQEQDMQLDRQNIMFVHIGKTGGETVRNLLLVACKMRKNPGHYKKCIRRFQSNYALNSTPLSQQTTGTIHCDLTVPKDALDKATALLVSVRNPIERVVSWYRYIHPGNCNPKVDRDSVACNIKRAMLGKPDIGWNWRFFGCFDSLQELGQALDPTLDTNCSLLGKRTLLGKANKISGHMYFNYEFYWRKTMAKKPNLKSLVVRTEHLWTDIDRVQELLWLGGDKSILENHPRLNHTHGSEGHKRPDSISSGSSLKWLCCILTKEVEIYSNWIREAINLDDVSKQQTLLDLVKRCGVDDATILDTPDGWETYFCPETTSFASLVKSAESSPWG